ncbi:hypothetical protein [Clostridium uliginosum]|uniref:hypothetical protein n=1 Tax=Clostridium uliginosum TaxID=119641 RepID=UPI001113A751|nr:hypothetical protein [Clostridium uliginosum]
MIISLIPPPFVILKRMKINNKSKVAMDIFHQARRRIAIISGLKDIRILALQKGTNANDLIEEGMKYVIEKYLKQNNESQQV